MVPLGTDRNDRVSARPAPFVARIKAYLEARARGEVTVETDREHSDAGSSAEHEDALPRDERVGSFADGEQPRDD